MIELLVVIAIIGILIGLLLPAVQSVREAARRTQCSNNIRQLGLAVLGFEGSHRVFPASGWTTLGPGNPAGKYVGWRPLILPYIEQGSLRDLYDVKLNWWEGQNLLAAAITVPTFLCPSAPQRPPVMSAIAKSPRPALVLANPLASTDYEAILGVQPSSINPHLPTNIYNATNRFSVMHRNSRNRFADILDGSSNTIMVVECSGRPQVYRKRAARNDFSNDQGICWADSEGPFSLDGASVDGMREGGGPAAGCNIAMNRKNDNEPYSFHPAGAIFLFADGHVNFISESISISAIAKLITRSGNEVIRDVEY